MRTIREGGCRMDENLNSCIYIYIYAQGKQMIRHMYECVGIHVDLAEWLILSIVTCG